MKGEIFFRGLRDRFWKWRAYFGWRWVLATKFMVDRAYQATKKNKYDKYGVIWGSTLNIGDDVQALAALGLLAKRGIRREDVILIDREKLARYKGPPVKVIMNGWYTHRKDLFLPPKTIQPLFISFHACEKALVRRYRHYFRNYAPIGCRDETTKGYFDELDIDAYVSGCLTLCFDFHKNKGDKTYLMDMMGPSPAGREPYPSVTIDTSAWSGALRSTHIMPLRDALISDVERRIIVAEEWLNNYREAKLVVTSRLHIALPCRAFGTDLIFFHPRYHTEARFSGLRKYLNGTGKQPSDQGFDFSPSPIDYSLIEEHKKRIDEKIADFVSSS